MSNHLLNLIFIKYPPRLLESIKEIAGFVGKRVFNYEEGDSIKLGIESQLSLTEV